MTVTSDELARAERILIERLERRIARLTVSLGAILTVTAAAELLGGRKYVSWLRREGLTVDLDGEERVLWSHVHERLASQNRTLAPKAQREVRRFKRDDWG